MKKYLLIIALLSIYAAAQSPFIYSDGTTIFNTSSGIISQFRLSDASPMGVSVTITPAIPALKFNKFAVDSSNNMYISASDNNLYQLNLNSGASTLIAALGDLTTSMTIDNAYVYVNVGSNLKRFALSGFTLTTQSNFGSYFDMYIQPSGDLLYAQAFSGTINSYDRTTIGISSFAVIGTGSNLATTYLAAGDALLGVVDTSLLAFKTVSGQFTQSGANSAFNPNSYSVSRFLVDKSSPNNVNGLQCPQGYGFSSGDFCPFQTVITPIGSTSLPKSSSGTNSIGSYGSFGFDIANNYVYYVGDDYQVKSVQIQSTSQIPGEVSTTAPTTQSPITSTQSTTTTGAPTSSVPSFTSSTTSLPTSAAATTSLSTAVPATILLTPSPTDQVATTKVPQSTTTSSPTGSVRSSSSKLASGSFVFLAILALVLFL